MSERGLKDFFDIGYGGWTETPANIEAVEKAIRPLFELAIREFAEPDFKVFEIEKFQRTTAFWDDSNKTEDLRSAFRVFHNDPQDPSNLDTITVEYSLRSRSFDVCQCSGRSIAENCMRVDITCERVAAELGSFKRRALKLEGLRIGA